MYHALSVDGSVDVGQDPHYSLRSDSFDSHLRRCTAQRLAITSARDWLAGSCEPAALISFDDGHISNFELAFPLLQARAATADFFVNSANVGRAGYASWHQLREMADAGQSIQSHSHEHRYLTSLGRVELAEQLIRSREMIEAGVGHPVTLLAPPGGRMPRGLAAVARACGYQHILSSRPGRIVSPPAKILPRMAVTASLDAATLDGWLGGDMATFAKAQLRYGVLAVMKRLFGDRGYEHLRRQFVGGPSEG